MKKEDKIFPDDKFSAVNQHIKALEKHIEKLEEAYNKKDHREFNFLKKQVIQTQKKIHSLIK